MQQTIVITGGSGFVGRHLVAEFLRELPEARLVVWDREGDDLPDEVVFVPVDITDPRTYEGSLRVERPAWVVHLAAFSAPSKSFTDPELVHAVNVTATQRLLEKITTVSSSTRMLAVSSADIYGHGGEAPLPELPLSDARPLNPYAESKLAMEEMIERLFLDRVVRVRPFAHVGPGQGLGFVTADFASQIVAIERGEQEPVMHVGDLRARRDFTDVRDVVRAYRLLLNPDFVGEVYHVASGTAHAISDVLERLIALAEVPITVEVDPARMRPSDVPVFIGDAQKLTAATGWRPTIPFPVSLHNILEWWRTYGTRR